MMPILIRRTNFGRRAERIDGSALQPMLVAGLVRKVPQGVSVYEEIDAPAVEAKEQLYETKVLVASEPKSRGRPQKARA